MRRSLRDFFGGCISPSLGTPGEGRGGGFRCDTRQNPHPIPPPEYQGRGQSSLKMSRSLRPPSNRRLLHLAAILIAAILQNAHAAPAVEEYKPFDGAKSTWHDG